MNGGTLLFLSQRSKSNMTLCPWNFLTKAYTYCNFCPINFKLASCHKFTMIRGTLLIFGKEVKGQGQLWPHAKAKSLPNFTHRLSWWKGTGNNPFDFRSKVKCYGQLWQFDCEICGQRPEVLPKRSDSLPNFTCNIFKTRGRTPLISGHWVRRREYHLWVVHACQAFWARYR